MPTELFNEKPVRPLDKNALGNDVAMLRNLLGTLNNPAITGAEVPPEEEQPPVTPPLAAPSPSPSLAPTPPAILRVVFTGQSGVGKDYVANAAGLPVVHVDTAIRVMVRHIFQDASDSEIQSLVDTFRAWGNGVVSPQYPLTPARWLIARVMAESWGKSGYWLRDAIDGPQRAAVTDITTGDDFKTLSDAGFVHFHVMCSASTLQSRPRRQGADNRMATHLDNQVVKRISAQKVGDRLRVIWNDPVTPPPAPARFWTLEQFIESMRPGEKE